MGKKFKSTLTALKHDRYERASKGQIRTKAYKKGYKDGIEKAKKAKMKKEFAKGLKKGRQEAFSEFKEFQEKLLDVLNLSNTEQKKLSKAFDDFLEK